MICPQCQRVNEAGATFCTNCGARLERLCPNCQTPNVSDARFCKRCGQALMAAAAATPPTPTEFAAPRSYTPKHLAEKILVSRSALEGERKQVTVLFVDVSGFTALSERLDPEDVHRLMTRAFELMLAEVHRYEGTVNQFLGDGIMALFGAPIAHEDHARRALQAALGIRTVLGAYEDELRQGRGITFQVRQGLNTGLVVVGSIGTDLRMDYTAVGDPPPASRRARPHPDRGGDAAAHRGLLPHPRARRVTRQGEGGTTPRLRGHRLEGGADSSRRERRARPHALCRPRARAPAPAAVLREGEGWSRADGVRRR